MDKKYVFTTRVGRDELFRFHMYSVFCNFQGVIALALSVLMAALLVITWEKSNVGIKILLFVAALYYPVYKPVALFLKSSLQAKTEAFVNGMTYTCDKENISINIGDQVVLISWSDVARIVRRKKEIYIYTGKLFAYIISREQGGKELEGLLEMLDNKEAV